MGHLPWPRAVPLLLGSDDADQLGLVSPSSSLLPPPPPPQRTPPSNDTDSNDLVRDFAARGASLVVNENPLFSSRNEGWSFLLSAWHRACVWKGCGLGGPSVPFFSCVSLLIGQRESRTTSPRPIPGGLRQGAGRSAGRDGGGGGGSIAPRRGRLGWRGRVRGFLRFFFFLGGGFGREVFFFFSSTLFVAPFVRPL